MHGNVMKQYHQKLNTGMQKMLHVLLSKIVNCALSYLEDAKIFDKC